MGEFLASEEKGLHAEGGRALHPRIAQQSWMTTPEIPTSVGGSKEDPLTVTVRTVRKPRGHCDQPS